MAFSVKNWLNLKGGDTPLNATSLKDLESRLSDYTDALVGPRVTPEDFGAKGDLQFVMDAGITSGQKTLTSATAAFTADDVGKVVHVRGAGHAEQGLGFTSKITAVTNGTTATVEDTATTTVADACLIWGTDDTEAFVSMNDTLIAEAQASGYNQVVADVTGRYMIAGAPRTGGTTEGNAQIPLPMIDSRLVKVKLTWRCPGRGAALYHWNQLPPQMAGPTLFSPLVAPEAVNGAAASIIGGPTELTEDPHGGEPFTNLLFAIDGSLTIMAPRRPKLIALDMRQVAEVDFDELSILTAACPAEMNEDATGDNFPGFANGLRFPKFLNNDLARCGSLSIEGYSFGIVPGDHVVIDRLATIYCGTAMFVNPGAPNHGLAVASWSAEVCQTIILAEGGETGKYPLQVKIECEVIEDTEFKDPDNTLRGNIFYSNFSGAAPTMTGAEKVQIHDVFNEVG